MTDITNATKLPKLVAIPAPKTPNFGKNPIPLIKRKLKIRLTILAVRFVFIAIFVLPAPFWAALIVKDIL